MKGKGSKKRKQAREKAGKGKDTNLARREQPTDRAYFRGSDRFTECLEETREGTYPEETFVEIIFARLATIRAKLRAGSRSPVPLCITGFLGNLALHVTRSPEWAQLGVVVLPWATALSLKALDRRRTLEHSGEPEQSRTITPAPDNT